MENGTGGPILNSRYALLIFVAAFLTFPPQSVRAQATDSVRLTVRIVDSRGDRPLPDAIIELSGIAETFPTGLDGATSIHVPIGTYVLIVRRAGYEMLEGDFRVWQPGSITLKMEANGEPTSRSRLTGTVVDSESNRPIEGAAVSFRGLGPMVTDDRGRFSFDDIPPGQARLDVEMIGYEDRDARIDVEAGRTIDIRVGIATQPIELEPITVEVRSRFLETKGVYRRMERGVPDRLVTRADIERRQAARLSDSLDDIPGLDLIRVNTRAMLRGRGRCLLRIFMDGVEMRPDMDGSVDIDQIPPEWVEVAEVYAGIAAVPAEYGGVREDCGVMLIWSRQRSR